MKRYGIMVIGCGHIGCEHLESIYYKENIRIVSVIDTNENAARMAAIKYGSEEYGTDYRDFINDERIDIVIVATYVSSHYEIVSTCIAHHKHVLCEKPISATSEQGEKFISMIKNADVKVQIAHILRYNHSYQKIYKIIKNGEIGKLKLIRMAQNHHTIDWGRYSRLLEDCSPIIDCGVHYYDIIRWFTGDEIVKVGGFGAKIDKESFNNNYTVMNFETKNGCIGYYEVGWGKNIEAQNLKQFIGERGRIELILADQRGDQRFDGDMIKIFHSDDGKCVCINSKSEYKDMYAQLCGLIDCIENDKEPVPSIEDVDKAFQIAIAADQAIKTGTIQYLD